MFNHKYLSCTSQPDEWSTTNEGAPNRGKDSRAGSKSMQHVFQLTVLTAQDDFSFAYPSCHAWVRRPSRRVMWQHMSSRPSENGSFVNGSPANALSAHQNTMGKQIVNGSHHMLAPGCTADMSFDVIGMSVTQATVNNNCQLGPYGCPRSSCNSSFMHHIHSQRRLHVDCIWRLCVRCKSHCMAHGRCTESNQRC